MMLKDVFYAIFGPFENEKARRSNVPGKRRIVSEEKLMPDRILFGEAVSTPT